MPTVRQIGLFPGGICGGPSVPALYDNQFEKRSDGSYATYTLTKAQATALCWRIKKWQYEFEIEQEGFVWANATTEWVNGSMYYVTGQSQGVCVVAGASPQPPSHITWAKLFDSNSYSASTEKDLLQYYDQKPSPLLGIHDYTVEAELASEVAYFETSEVVLASIAIRRIPQNNLNGTFTASISIGWTLLPMAFPSRFNNTSAPNDLSGTLSFLGNSFSFPARSGDFGAVSTSYPTENPATSGPRHYNYQKTNTFVFNITPAEYWPYDPGDGLGPIYDSTTGAQLRPFPA